MDGASNEGSLCTVFFLHIRSDWGCLILVDDRFGKGGKYTNGEDCSD